MNDVPEDGSLPEKFPPSQKKTALLDAVETIIRSKWEDSELHKYLVSIENDKSVTGDVEIDRAFAARIVIEIGIESGLGELFEGKTLTKVRNAVNAAMRRNDMGTQQRLERQKRLEDKNKDVA
jgi:hypothetical protein